MNEFITKFLSDNSALGKTKRTILECIIGIILANLDQILFSVSVIPPEVRTVIVGVVTTILTPVLNTLKKSDEKLEDKTE